MAFLSKRTTGQPKQMITGKRSAEAGNMRLSFFVPSLFSPSLSTLVLPIRSTLSLLICRLLSLTNTTQ